MNRDDTFEWAAEPYWLKYIPEHERADIPADQFAGPGRTFPIRNETDLENAAYLVGHAKDPTAVRDKAIAIARRLNLRLPESWQHHVDSRGKSLESDLLVFMGGEVKKLDDRKIGGYLCLFTTPKDPDLANDYFTKDTDFDIYDGERRSLYYNHGMDETIGNRKIGDFTTRKDDVGLWLEAQLAARDEYADAVLSMVEKGAVGYSSGSIAHLVRREKPSKNVASSWLKHWPIGEGSITPTPCEPRLRAVPLKMWFNQASPAAPNKAAVSITDIRTFEDFLRESGFPKDAAVTIASKGFNALRRRDAEESEANSDTFRKDCLMELARAEIVRARRLGVVV